MCLAYAYADAWNTNTHADAWDAHTNTDAWDAHTDANAYNTDAYTYGDADSYT